MKVVRERVVNLREWIAGNRPHNGVSFVDNQWAHTQVRLARRLLLIELDDMMRDLLFASEAWQFQCESVLAEILAERRQQQAKWGEQNHDFGKWATILLEELGEASREFLHATSEDPANAAQRARNMRKELVQVAAVAAQIIEVGDRNTWWPSPEHLECAP